MPDLPTLLKALEFLQQRGLTCAQIIIIIVIILLSNMPSLCHLVVHRGKVVNTCGSSCTPYFLFAFTQLIKCSRNERYLSI